MSPTRQVQLDHTPEQDINVILSNGDRIIFQYRHYDDGPTVDILLPHDSTITPLDDHHDPIIMARSKQVVINL